MPDSVDHCKNCAFEGFTGASGLLRALEHTVNMDAIYERGDMASVIREQEEISDETKRRLEAAEECGQRIIQGQCVIYGVVSENGKKKLIDKIQVH